MWPSARMHYCHGSAMPWKWHLTLINALYYNSYWQKLFLLTAHSNSDIIHFLLPPLFPPARLSPPSVSGTTCLVALLSDKELTVANVGDSRGVLCDKDGNAIPLSHDHKPYQLKERKRIKKAGEETAAVQTSRPFSSNFKQNKALVQT